MLRSKELLPNLLKTWKLSSVQLISKRTQMCGMSLNRQQSLKVVIVGQNSRDVKSSRPKWPRGQNFGLGLGLGLKALASASALASNTWPRPGLGLQQKNQQPRRDRRTNLHFTLPTTGHHTMTEDSYCARENEKLNCVVLIDHNDINSPVCCQPSFDTFYS